MVDPEFIKSRVFGSHVLDGQRSSLIQLQSVSEYLSVTGIGGLFSIDLSNDWIAKPPQYQIKSLYLSEIRV